MMMDSLYPRNKNDLARVIQKMRITKIEIFDDYSTSDERELLSTLKDMSRGTGDVTVIVVRS
ncbi:hypothetical protein [Aliiroseovarius sp. xm-g-7]|uniref:hypothetical protein n=1 Tax=Aliiroseovarius sp. xm-g-7 TaxID=2651826 RepID=UPI001567F27D|nr:hypothetical protein [Aliiroseovarius sp. xm-g-7]NRQ25865.1 hypothetical protein [Aliiroseovarius sp. xm-g-7]